LPYIEQQGLHRSFTFSNNVGPLYLASNQGGSFVNGPAVATEVAVYLCPSDGNARQPFVDYISSGLEWARGNYGYNMGNFFPSVDMLRRLRGEIPPAPPSLLERVDFFMGIGAVEGVEKSVAKIADGTTNTIMIGEMRAGLSQSDRRGVWAMGMCASNFHCRHGFNGAQGVNSCFGEEDDFVGVDKVKQEVGEATMRAECMWGNGWASAQSVVRSLHPDGAHAAFADGSVRLLNNFIDAGRVGVGEFLGQDTNDIVEANFGVWQRLLAASDGYTVTLPQ
jgi:prepilin-type processing-associated H-X9-DG protein